MDLALPCPPLPGRGGRTMLRAGIALCSSGRGTLLSAVGVTRGASPMLALWEAPGRGWCLSPPSVRCAMARVTASLPHRRPLAVM